jgi:Family of unknown function (DUF6152)
MRTVRFGKRDRTLAALALLAAATTLGVAAHADDALPEAYDPSRRLDLEGSILALRWIEPHVELGLLARDGTVWDIELTSIIDLQRAGVSRDRLVVGTEIRVAGHPARNGDLRLLGMRLQLPSGGGVGLRAERIGPASGRSQSAARGRSGPVAAPHPDE